MQLCGPVRPFEHKATSSYKELPVLLCGSEGYSARRTCLPSEGELTELRRRGANETVRLHS